MSIAAKGCVHSKRWQSIELRDQRLICENWIWLACQASPLGNLGFVSNLFNVHLNLQKHNVFLTTGLHISCIPLTGFNLPFPHRPGWIVDFEGQNGDSDPRRTGQYWAFMAITLRSPQGPWYKIALEAPLHRLVGIHTLASKTVTSQAEVQRLSKAKSNEACSMGHSLFHPIAKNIKNLLMSLPKLLQVMSFWCFRVPSSAVPLRPLSLVPVLTTDSCSRGWSEALQLGRPRT